MQHWSLPAAPQATPVQRCLSGLIGRIGHTQFAERALGDINTALAAGSWAVYQRFDDDRPPVLHLSASHGVADTTRDCFAVYRDAGLYQRDASLREAALHGGQPVMLRMHAEDAPNADHRDAIYTRHGVVERLSVAAAQADRSVLAVNLYHHRHQGRFRDAELNNFGELAHLLLAGVQRHIALQGAPAAPAEGGVRAALRAHCAELSSRELDVLERLLAGLSYDGIAADLGLSLATVKTYRARAFARLGLHFKSELFAHFMPRAEHRDAAVNPRHPLG